ncbi:hypothetical protein OBBRIDRAFT_742875, partial [Obba rivulosa]
SDGQSMLRATQEREHTAKSRTAGACGPHNQTLQHWHAPKYDVADNGSLCWLFGCKYYKATRTAPCSKGCKSFTDESPKPPLGNLATHTKQTHQEQLEQSSKDGEEADDDGGEVPQSTDKLMARKIMKSFIKKGLLHPKLKRTRKGFRILFAVWFIEANLPFTTGESSGLARLFRYLEVNEELPSDTTHSTDALTMDNASANDVMACTLSKLLQKRYLIPFVPENSQICYLAHVVNLVVQKMLSALNDAEDPNIVDYYLGQKFLPIHYDPNEDEEAVAHDGPERAAADKTTCENLPEEDKDEFDNIETGLTSVQKVCYVLFFAF